MSTNRSKEITWIKQNIEKITDIEKLAAQRHSKNVNKIIDDNLTFGDRIADKLADFAGSWKFIIIFVSIIFLWIVINSIQLLTKSFDVYPFILLNLLLSCIAALQAPVIMMSQNRQETKDRLRAEHDYEINLKSEILVEEMIKRLQKLEDNQKLLLAQHKDFADNLNNTKNEDK